MFKEYSRRAKILFHNLIPTLLADPVFFFQRGFLQLKSMVMPLPKSPMIKKINGISFELNFNYCPEMKNFYFGTYEARLTRILKYFLKEGDTFIDVGANIGYISAFALGCVGKNGFVHSFEPVVKYRQRIQKTADLNKNHTITINPCAVGQENGKIKLYSSLETGFGCDTIIKEKADSQDFIEVPIKRLDDYIKENHLANIKVIKIDVEGFEFDVLRGLEKYLLECKNSGSGPLIICEIHPDWLPLVGANIQDLFEYMARFSYYPFDIITMKKQVLISQVENEPLINVVFKYCA